MVRIHYTNAAHALRAEFQSQSSARGYLRQTMLLNNAAPIFNAAELISENGALLCKFSYTRDGTINILENPQNAKAL